jgi:hypothetical protein
MDVLKAGGAAMERLGYGDPFSSALSRADVGTAIGDIAAGLAGEV